MRHVDPEEPVPGRSKLLSAMSLIAEALGRLAAVSVCGPTSRSSDKKPLSLTAQIHLPNTPDRISPTLTLALPGRDPGARETLVLVVNRERQSKLAEWRSVGQSFVDLTGKVFIVAPGLIIDREVNRLRVESADSVARSPFGDKSSLVTRCLLDQAGGKTWDLQTLAAAAQSPVPTTAGVVRWLADAGFVTTVRRGRSLRIELTDPIGLFMRWTHAYGWDRNERLTLSAPIAEPRRFLPRLADQLAETRWALTMNVGGDLLGLHAIARKIHVYVDVKDKAELMALAVTARWHPDAHGRLVLMRPFYKHSLWKSVRRIQESPVVSDIQLALDLWHYPERGVEQAEHILQRHFPEHTGG